MVPLNIRFDGALNTQGSSVVHLPKLSQGAPYFFGFRIRNEDTTYRDFSSIEGARMRLKLRPSDTQDLLVLTKANNNFSVTTNTVVGDTFNIVMSAADWDSVALPRSENHMEMDVPFAFVLEFLNANGVVTERFAQGSGLISVNLVSE